MDGFLKSAADLDKEKQFGERRGGGHMERSAPRADMEVRKDSGKWFNWLTIKPNIIAENRGYTLVI